jgi:hypothetical protein
MKYVALIKVSVVFETKEPLTDEQIQSMDINTTELSWLKKGSTTDYIYYEKDVVGDLDKENGYEEDYTELVDIQEVEDN